MANHRMVLRVNEAGEAAWVCPICGRTITISSSGMKVINHGDFEATHYGAGIANVFDAPTTPQPSFNVEVERNDQHPWDRPISHSPEDHQGPWWEAPDGTTCKI